MKKEIISAKQGVTIMSLFIIGSTLILGGDKKASEDTWIAIIISMIMVLPMLIIYARILSLFPDKNLFEIAKEVLGKIFSKIIILLFTLYFFYLGALVIRNVTEFVQIVSFPETPQFFIAFSIGLLSIYMVKSSIEVLGRLAELLLYLIIFISICTVFLSISKMELINIKPMLYDGWKPVLESGFSLFAFPFAETVIFTVVLGSLKQNSNPYKVYIGGLIIGGAFILIISIRNILILGISSILSHYFPSYSAVSLIEIGDFLERIETIAVIVFILSSFVKISICLFSASMGFASLFNFNDHTQITAPIAFLMLNLSIIVYNSIMEMFEWLDIYPYYAIPFQIILPLIVWIAAEVKTKSGIPSKG